MCAGNWCCSVGGRAAGGAVAERLTFKNFGWDCAKGEGFCLVGCAGAREDGVFRHSDLTAEVRYLTETGKAPLVFDSAEEALRPVERVRGMTVMPGGTWYEFDPNYAP